MERPEVQYWRWAGYRKTAILECIVVKKNGTVLIASFHLIISEKKERKKNSAAR